MRRHRASCRGLSTFARDFEFESMARRPMYEACPRWLIEQCQIGESSTVVDLGCGSGIVTELLLERSARSRDFHVIAVDPSEWELEIARSRIRDSRVTFIHGTAQDAVGRLAQADVDAVVLCNVLHQVPRADRRSLLEGAFALLRPGGLVGANTLFYDGGVPRHTWAFYVRWMAEARSILARELSTWEEPVTTPVARQRLSPQQHRELLQTIGFEDVHIEELPFEWTLEDWEALCRYSVFIQGALSPGIDLELGSRALIEGVRIAFRTLGIQAVPRGWLHCVARRPSIAAA